MSRVFISYRRDDAAGYAGRLEDALEQRLGSGSVFRDIADIPPGADFASLIARRIAAADVTLVLIGPQWLTHFAQSDPAATDFVKVEVATALASSCIVVPVILPGGAMPSADQLPPELRPLAERNALFLSEPSWQSDIDRLANALGATRRFARTGMLLLVAVAIAGLTFAGHFLYQRSQMEKLVGEWVATVRYDWGDVHDERYRITLDANVWEVSASYLGYPRTADAIVVDGRSIRFQTQNEQSMSGVADSRVVTHRYEGRLQGDTIAFVLRSSGGFTVQEPVRFVARRAAAHLQR